VLQLTTTAKNYTSQGNNFCYLLLLPLKGKDALEASERP